MQGLLITNNEQLRTNCLTLINAIITAPDDLDFRMHLRNEFMRVGLVDVLYTLDREGSPEELQLQLKVFYEHRDEDFDEFAQRYKSTGSSIYEQVFKVFFIFRFDNLRLDLDDVNECFELIKNTVMDTSAEPYFLSVLQVKFHVAKPLYSIEILKHLL